MTGPAPSRPSSPSRPSTTGSGSVIEWLLDSDPSIRWQVMRDLLGAPEDEWTAERAAVAAEGWGARLLSCEDEDGQWAGGAFFPRDFEAREWREVGQPWTATAFSLSQLREFGLDPSCDRAQRAVRLVGANSRWEEGGQPYWEGEVEECINGRTVADGAYFGVDVSSLVSRLVGERLDDGGWNCERANGSADEQFLRFTYPNRWRYDVLRALDYFRSTGAAPDPRLGEAVGHVRSRRREDGTWVLDWRPPGRVWFELDDGVDEPSRWVTLRAMRVLGWWESGADRALRMIDSGSSRNLNGPSKKAACPL